MSEKMEGYRSIVCMIKQSARLDRNPKIGRVMPKGMQHLERYSWINQT